MSAITGDLRYLESDDGRYRYMLTRVLPEIGEPLVFCMLNPSTANATQDDPTIRRCVGFALREGAEALIVVNLYARRATKPKDLWAAADPVGCENDDVIRFLGAGRRVVCAWGSNAKPARVKAVASMLRNQGATLLCLGTTANGSPRHPLYVRADQPLVPYTGDLH